MMKWKHKIQADVSRRLRQKKGTRKWLQSADKFESGNYFDEESREYALRLFYELELDEGYKIDDKQRTFETLLANLFNAHPKPVAASRNRNFWAKPEYSNIKYEISEYINRLNEEEFIDMKPGYYFEDKAELGKIWPTEKLLNYFPKKKPRVHWKPVNLIELRDSETRQLKRYDETDYTRRIHRILKQANSVNGDAEIWYGGEEKIRAFLIAIFVDDFSLYGRLHTRGYRHYQGLSEDERAEITINGDRVIELDYRALNPYLLYAEEGRQYFGDPYTAVHSNSVARPFLKQILLSMLNAKNERQAESAANYWLYKNHDERKKLKKIGITRARPLMEEYKEAHKPIAHHFCSGKETGLRVMNKDAGIALDVVNHFTEKDIPILAIHDSFIVQHQFRDELHQTMKRMYSKHADGFRCHVH